MAVPARRYRDSVRLRATDQITTGIASQYRSNQPMGSAWCDDLFFKRPQAADQCELRIRA
jgi:hypothetical protein